MNEFEVESLNLSIKKKYARAHNARNVNTRHADEVALLFLVCRHCFYHLEKNFKLVRQINPVLHL